MTDLRAVITQARFTPSQAQIRYRNEFWSKQAGELPAEVNLEVAITLGASGRIKRWWDIPGFQEWFTSKDWNKHVSELLLTQAMDRLSEVLRDSTDHGTLIAAAKEARTLHAQLTAPVKGEEKYADEEISIMSKEQLADFIKKNTTRGVQ